MSEQHAASPEDARAALASAKEMHAAAARRAAWPVWLSLVVALAYGAQGAVLTTHWDGMARGPLAVALGLAAWLLVVLMQRLRGVKAGRVTNVRVIWANVIHIAALLGPPMIRDHSLALEGAGPLILGGLESAAILAVFAIIARVERNGLSEDGQ